MELLCWVEKPAPTPEVGKLRRLVAQWRDEIMPRELKNNNRKAVWRRQAVEGGKRRKISAATLKQRSRVAVDK